jgi:hypothetical protein
MKKLLAIVELPLCFKTINAQVSVGVDKIGLLSVVISGHYERL